MHRFLRKIKDESAGVMVENVIVLPLVFVVVIFMIISAFLIHDRVVIETAAREGVLHAAHCISDPNYAVASKSFNNDFENAKVYVDFSGAGKNVNAYRYITGGVSVQKEVESKVKKMVNNNRINWTKQDNITVKCDQNNKIIYQDVTVNVAATYHLPGWIEWFGLESEYKITTSAKMAAVDPDEFIRNADLVVDLMTQIDGATGGYMGKAVASISSMASRLVEWIKLD